MKKIYIYITGVSGTGKTAIAETLKAKGIYAISMDEEPGLCSWRHKATGREVTDEVPLNRELIDAHDWVCDTELLKKLLAVGKDAVVVLGFAANQDEFLGLFDKILLLQCKPETFLKRIQERKDNDFGKDKGAQEWILGWYKGFEDDLLRKGAVPIDVEESLEKVVGKILAEIA